MTRREMLVLMAPILMASRLGLGQANGVARIGVLAAMKRPKPFDGSFYDDLVRALRDLGYVEGRALTLEWRFADGDNTRSAELAAELTHLRLDVIVAEGTPAVLALQKTTATIPIVFPSAGDPVGNGLVQSLSHPGGNITGISTYAGDSTESIKQLELLRTMVPGLSTVAALCNPTNPYTPRGFQNLEAAGATLNVKVVPVEIRVPGDIEPAFETMKRRGVGAFLFIRDGLVFQQRRQIADLAARYKLPYLGGLREHPEAGGLMSYGLDLHFSWRRAAVYVDKILKGAKPADLPVELPSKFELVINRKTAKALGLTIPPELLMLADKVIE